MEVFLLILMKFLKRIYFCGVYIAIKLEPYKNILNVRFCCSIFNYYYFNFKIKLTGGS